MPKPVVEVAIGVICAFLAAGVRMAFLDIAGNEAPYAFTFLAVVIAAVLAGVRAGLVALVLSQLLTWYLVVQPNFSLGLLKPEDSAALALATSSAVLVLAVIGLYQREVAKGVSEREKRLDLLGQALDEIDHRTRNNYQTVLALVQLQAQRAKDEGVRSALQQVADRINAVTHATERLAVRSGDLATVRLRDHLCELCEHVERGLSRDGVRVKCEVEDLAASTEKAIYLAIIVNELVTNALKHAFDEANEGVIRVASERTATGVTIIVEDNGRGFDPRRQKERIGLGTRLVERFARELGCKHDVRSTSAGTTHRLLIPSLA